MENKLDKKTLISTIIASVFLVTLVVGATYSYFTITSQNNFGTKSLTAEIEDMANNVTLTQESSSLSLDLSRVQMSEANKGTYYYATGSSTPANIAKIMPDGEGSYTCDYTMSITKSATNDMYTAFQGMSTKSTNQIYLEIGGTKYDFNTANLFPKTHTGRVSGVTQDSPGYITANMTIYNKNVNQNALKGTDITLTFSITNFSCKSEEGAPIFATYQEDFGSLIFFQNYDADTIQVGKKYKGYDVDAIYTNLNNTNFTSAEDVPWDSNIMTFSFNEKIQPLNTSYWFTGTSHSGFVNVENFDTSQVTDMSYMFSSSGIIGCSIFQNMNFSKVVNMEGMFSSANFDCDPLIENWDLSNVRNMSYMFERFSNDLKILEKLDTSNVEDMSYMFRGAGMGMSSDLDLSGWNTEKVKNMSYMFEGYEGYYLLNLSNWNLSNVEDMSHMFENYWGNSLPNLSNWNTSNVRNMSHMFYEFGANISEGELNLSSWQVPLVKYHENFNTNSNTEADFTIIPPIWVN